MIFMYYYIREDVFLFYGFLIREEKVFFIKFLNVIGIGLKGVFVILGLGDLGVVI